MPGICMVTGGAGFIGCAISRMLPRQFDRVIAVDNLHPQINAGSAPPAMLDQTVELVIGDITISETWDRLLQQLRPDVAIHLAAETGTAQSLTEATRHANVNVTGTAQMLDAFVRHDALPSRIVLSSSRAVYGEGAWQRNETGEIVYPGQRSHAQLERQEWDFRGFTSLPAAAATTTPHPTSVYGATKLAQEHIVRAWALSFGIEVAILRLQNVYGPGQALNNPYTGVVPLFAQLAREGSSIPIYEDGQIIRDFVFIDDVVDAICRVTCDAALPSITYDVGSGQSISILQLGTIIAEFYDAPHPHISGMFRNGDVRHASCDITRTQADLNWSPKWSILTGISRLCNWIDECSVAHSEVVNQPTAPAGEDTSL